VENPLSQVTGFEYDPAARVTRQVLPSDDPQSEPEILFEYDESGNLSSLQPPGPLAFLSVGTGSG
jgi:YD repeat-containing protein